MHFNTVILSLCSVARLSLQFLPSHKHVIYQHSLQYQSHNLSFPNIHHLDYPTFTCITAVIITTTIIITNASTYITTASINTVSPASIFTTTTTAVTNTTPVTTTLLPPLQFRRLHQLSGTSSREPVTTNIIFPPYSRPHHLHQYGIYHKLYITAFSPCFFHRSLFLTPQPS